MATESLAQLVVKLQVQSAQYQQRLDQADNRIRRFQRQQDRSTRQVQQHFTRLERAQNAATERMSEGIKKLGAAMVAFASVNAFKTMITDAIDAMNSMDDFSVRIGITVEELSKLHFAAESSGISIRTLEMALQRQTRRTAEAAEQTGAAVKAYQSLNLSAKDMARLSPDAQLREIAEAMRGISDQGERVKIAMQIWDSEGVKMLQMVDGLEQMTAQAEELGLVISTDMAKSATAFNAEIVKIKTIFSVAAKVLAGEMLPTLKAIVNKSKEWVGILKDKIDFKGSVEQLKEMRDSLAQGVAFAGKYDNIFTFGGIDRAREKIDDLNVQIAALEKAGKGINDIDLGFKWGPLDSGVGGADPKTKNTRRGKGAGKGAGMIGDAEEDALSRKLGKIQEANFKIEDSNKQSALRSLDGLLTQLDGEEGAIKASMDRRLEIIEEANKKQVISDQTASDLKHTVFKKAIKEREEAEKEGLQSKLTMAGDIAGQLAGMAKSENSKMIEIQRASAIVQATMSGATAYVGALGTPPYGVGSIVMAGIIAAQTAVQIATIAGARAKGGPVTGGKNYLVGEAGPEIFQAPSGGGNIIPNGAAPGVNVTIIEDASKAGQVTQNGQDVQVYVAAAMSQLHSEFNSGTGLFAAMEGRYGLSR